MNTVCGKFSLAGEDIGLNDSNHCVLMLTFYNEAIYTLNITCSISEDTGRDRTRLTLQGGQSARASLTVTRRSDISVTSLLNSVRVTWTSGDKKGICDLALDGLHLSLASPSPVTFAYRVSSGEHLDCLSVTVTLSKPEPNSFLYIYPYSEASDSFKLLPKSLVLAGTLSVSLPDVQGDFTYSLHYKKLTDDAYWVVAAIGSRKSVTVWAHQAWAL
jgi:hypothetical protein